MSRSKPNLASIIVLFLIGIGAMLRFGQNLFHISQNVRMVDVVGLTGGGAACGAGLFGFVYMLVAKNKA